MLYFRKKWLLYFIFALSNLSSRGWLICASEIVYSQPSSHVVILPAQLRLPPAPIYDPRKFGALGDGITFDTDAIQKAIDACEGTGGSVVLSPGDYVSKPLILRGHMTFFLKKGARLLGSTKLADFPIILADSLKGHFLCRSLLYAFEADNLKIDGEGVIDGQCKLMDIPDELKKAGTERLRPSLIRVFKSKNVEIRNVTLSRPCMWTQTYSDCDNLVIDHVIVDAPPDCPNLDGMDICDSSNVIIRNCDVNSEDDCICLKSNNQRGLKNILIENNRVHSFRANAIKLGTATKGPVTDIRIINNLITYAKYGGLCIESVDGSKVSDIVVRDLDIYRSHDPIFIRLAERSGTVGFLKDVLIENIRAFKTNYPDKNKSVNLVTPSMCTITGIPQARLRNIRIKNCYIEMPGGVEKITYSPQEKVKDYPQCNMFGTVPAYGIYVRHADNVILENVYFGKYTNDVRPWYKVEDSTLKFLECKDLQIIKSYEKD
jgi:hypothetical protein